MELTIDDIAFGGKGVGRLEGKAVFVPFTIDGERVAARITREKKNLAEAELETVLEPSIHRTQPECPYFGECGGCTYQHISYPHQLAIKAQQVEQTLRRIAQLSDVPMQPIVPSPRPYGYRNRITVRAQDGLVGYFRREAHHLIDVEQCPIAAPEVNHALTELRASRPRDGHYTLRAQAAPRVFAQTNDAVAEALAQHVVGLMPTRADLLVDAYCGAGFFAKRLTAQFERVLGLEWDRHAVAAAQKNMAPNESYIAADAGRELRHALISAEPAATAVIVDPPATGLTDVIRRALLETVVQTFVYVSCNPATLARDLRELGAVYSVRSVTPFDMFPQTAEIEVAVHLFPSAKNQ